MSNKNIIDNDNNTFIPILQQTSNFFELYQYMCGKSEVPVIFNFWASVALLAAVLEDRIWIEKFKGAKLYPHLYIVLIGEGGLGKGEAISIAFKLATNSVNLSKFRGQVTYAHMVDILGKPQKNTSTGNKEIIDPHLWLIMDELKNDVGSNKIMAEAFIAMMTELYTASNYQFDTGTRTHGKISIMNPLVNWTVGSTETWLRSVLTRELVESGFTSRACFIFGEYDFSVRYDRPVVPIDYDDVYRHLQARLWAIQALSGEVSMTDDARMVEKKWYDTRAAPDDRQMFSIWRRHHDMVLKFAMLHCVADGGALVIQAKHVMRAIAMVKTIGDFTNKLIEVAHETYNTKPSNEIEEYIKKRKTIDHSTALRYFRTKRGMDAKAFKNAIMSLIQEKVITYEKNKHGGMIYKYN